MKVIVTGIAGFIGYHTARALLAAGHTVVGVDNLSPYYSVQLKRDRLAELARFRPFEFNETDIGDLAAMSALFSRHADATHVVHLAAQAGVRYSLINPRAYARANVDGFLAVLEACRAHPVRHLIYASSSSVYGANSKVPYHEDDPVTAPVSLYAATKRADELMAQTYAHLYGIACSGVRFFTVYGPWGRPDMAYYLFTKAITEGRTIDVYNHGKLRRDFTYIDDVVEALVRLIDLPPGDAAKAVNPGNAAHIIYNVGNHTPVELERFIGVLETALGRTADKRYLPMQPGDVLATYADVERLSRATGFAPRTSIEDGVGRFVAWFRAYHGSGS